MACSFLIQLVFCKKKNYVVYWCWSRARDECTPPQKNPGSAPAYRWPNLFWAFLCFGLELSPFFPKISLIHGTWYILHVFWHWQKYLYFVKWILMVCTSCKSSYTALSHTNAIMWGLIWYLSGEWGKSNAKERDSPYFRSPEAGISEFGKRLLHYVTLLLQPSSHVLNLIM